MSDPKQPRQHVRFGNRRRPDGHPAQRGPAGPGRPGAGEQAPDIQMSAGGPRKGARLWFAGGFLALAGLVAYAVSLDLSKPDPHYVAAEKAVRSYEQGKPVEQRNYAQPLYQEALDELALVDPDSISADQARALAEEIRLGIHDLEARNASRDESNRRFADKVKRRRKEVLEASTRDRMNPQTTFPECEHEEGDGHDHENDGS